VAAKTVTIEEAAGHLDELIEKANAGDEVILEKSGRPVAKLVALERKVDAEQRRTWGGYEGRIWMSDDFDAPLSDDFWFSGKP
jgi:prevent-host-death family protein